MVSMVKMYVTALLCVSFGKGHTSVSDFVKKVYPPEILTRQENLILTFWPSPQAQSERARTADAY